MKDVFVCMCVCVHACACPSSGVECWVTVMERFKGGGEMEMSGGRSGGDENLVQSVVDGLRKEGKWKRRRQTTGEARAGERS